MSMSLRQEGCHIVDNFGISYLNGDKYAYTASNIRYINICYY